MAVVQDAAIRRRLADLMQPVWDAYTACGALGFTPFNRRDPVESFTTLDHFDGQVFSPSDDLEAGAGDHRAIMVPWTLL